MKVVVAGGFDPYHRGHRSHLIEAKKLGDYLIVIVQRDEQLIIKKGWRLLPLEDRVCQIRDLKFVDQVVVNIDYGTTFCAETLAMIKPDIFAKGGSRIKNVMPQDELDICEKLGIKIVYGVGELLGSSSGYFKKAMEQCQQLQNAERR